ncbi:disease resistance protein Roq1-like [Cryptomeria japonica]|uniref:disease resistance protein Roq1-like n=1 Tax=Cryptomeria japonica TaxID=3369 RepID=UPI0027DA4EBD|nr:disease resistance protein Roq1-like [Cryptomeria japonica]
MASSSSSPVARSIVSAKLYDVFISHRGPDVKETLAKQLYDLLQERRCQAFLDREEIKGGDSIPSAIHNAICSSVVQIAIFSKGYAESSWCLDELVLMLQQTDALFIPVFYDVKPWELRYIENKNSQYAAAFFYYQSQGRNLDKLHKWKSSLESASNISGYELSQYQDNLCEKIVSRVIQVVQEKKNSIALDVAKYPVELAKLVQDFERSCSKTETVRDKLLEDLFPKDQEIKELKIRSVHDGIGKLKYHLGRARHLHFLIILDDIDRENQLDALLPEGMLNSGSLDPPIAYEKLVEKFVEFCGGLPLSLEVLGAHVYRRNEHYWG